MSSYRYSPLDSAAQEIRLLKLLPGLNDAEIMCNIFHCSLAAPPEYEALSYTWGDAMLNTLQSIQIASCPFSVTSNLFSALQRLRNESAVRTVWIDAICINQNNLDERAQQVPLMKNIYSNAQGVVIWLGPESDATALAMRWLKNLDTFYRLFYREGPTPTPTDVALSEFLVLPWWSRVWIIQELGFAKRASFLCGSQHIDLKDFQDNLFKAVEVLEEEHEGRSLPSYLSRALSLVSTRGIVQMSDSHGGCPFPLVLQKHLHNQATDPRDHVYALLGLSTSIGVPEILISYHPKTTTRQVYAHFVKRWIKRYFDLDIITNYVESQEQTLDLPSWVPDWSGKQSRPRWDTGTSNTWGRSGGFSTWTVGPYGSGNTPSTWRTTGNPEWNIDMAITEQDEMKFISAAHYTKFLTLDGVIIDEIEYVDSTLRPFQTYKDLFTAWEPKDVQSGNYKTDEAKVSVFLQTLFSGRYKADHLITTEEAAKLVDNYEIYMNRKQHPHVKNKHDSRDAFPDSALEKLLYKLHLRTFAITKSGYYALVPTHAQKGDSLVALVGGNVPFVLRRVNLDESTIRQKATNEHQPSPPIIPAESVTSSNTPTAPSYAVTPSKHDLSDFDMINGPAYSGTSRGPQYPLIYHQQLNEGQDYSGDENNDIDIGLYRQFFIPRKRAGSDSYDPTFKIVGTAYVHGVMNGEVKRAYEKGWATLQTYLLV